MAISNGNVFDGLKICVLLAIIGSCVGESNYTVTAPQKLRANSQYRFAVTVYGLPRSNYKLKAKIESTSGKVLVQDVFNVKQSTLTKLCSLPIPISVPFEDYNFVLAAEGNVEFNVSHNVGVVRKVLSLYIQTDKFLYKPGQTVLYRVIVIDSNLKPVHKPVNITIYDQASNRIQQLFDQKNKSGVINGHLKLSDITPLGQWKIEANTGNTKQEVFFQVAEYVLPKYEVKVILPSYFFLNENNPSAQKDLLITVTAIYTFGKPVKGYVNIRVTIPREYIYWAITNTTVPYIEKKLELIDGKADTSLSVEQLNKLDPSGTLRNYYSLFVQANVTEAATGDVLQGNSSVQIHSQRYRLEFLSISSDNFMPGFNYRAYVKLSQMDESQPLLADITCLNGSMKELEVIVESFRETPYRKVIQIQLSTSGLVFFEIPTDSNWTNFNIQVNFNDSVANNPVSAYKYLNAFETRDKKYIQLSLVGTTSVIKPNTKPKFTVKTTEKVNEFQYQVLGKGIILKVGSVSTRKATTDFTFTMNFDRDLVVAAAPEARVVVFYVTTTGELVADSMALSVTNYFLNEVSLAFDPTSTAPGKEVQLNVNASAGSYVFLLAVDQSVLLLSGGNDITKQMVTGDLRSYTTDSDSSYDRPIFFDRWPIWLGGSNTNSLLENAGLFVATNYHIFTPPFFYPGIFFRRNGGMIPEAMPMMAMAADFDMAMPGMAVPAATAPTSESSGSEPPRTKFPETWIWSDVIAGSDGSTKLKYVVPDAITSWTATGFATHTKYGLGITDNSTQITVLKPFFILLNLPYSIIRGEQFALVATVFNYYGQDLQVNVSLPKSNYYNAKECVNGSEKESQNESTYKIVFVPNNDVVTVYFWIVATSLGQIPIEVKALAGLAADSLIVNLLVKPEGQQQSYSSSSLIRLPPGNTTEVNFVVTLPPTDVLVPGSEIIEATVIGDVLGSAINNLDKLLQMPSGCGEQNMLTLAPDVYIVKYLTATNQLTEEIKTKALGFISEGYQRELTYQRNDGSFSAFGNQDTEGSVWLSAFVLRVFVDAKDMIPIEDSKITQTLQWILRHQDSKGVFKEPPEGRVIHTDMQGGSSSGVALTAYVLITLLKNENADIPDLKTKTTLGVSYLEKNYKNYTKDPYVLGIISYVFYLSKSSELTNVHQLLDALATKEGGMTYWHKEVPGTQNDPDVWTPPYSRPQSNDVEMTSYCLITYASQGDLSNSIPIAKWLIKSRNAQGGFTSTQDTVLGLESLSIFGKLVVPSSASIGLTIELKQDGSTEVHKFDVVNRGNALLLQSIQLKAETKKVTFSASGQGLALVQLNVQYNVKSQQKNELINQVLSAKSNETKLDLTICLKWSGTEQTGMVLTEVNLLTGYVLSDGYADVLKNDLGTFFKKQEYNNNALSIYLDEITSKELCFTVKMESAFYVSKVKPALVKTYQYYSPAVVATGYYSPTSTSADVNVCDPIFNQDGGKK